MSNDPPDKDKKTPNDAADKDRKAQDPSWTREAARAQYAQPPQNAQQVQATISKMTPEQRAGMEQARAGAYTNSTPPSTPPQPKPDGGSSPYRAREPGDKPPVPPPPEKTRSR